MNGTYKKISNFIKYFIALIYIYNLLNIILIYKNRYVCFSLTLMFFLYSNLNCNTVVLMLYALG